MLPRIAHICKKSIGYSEAYVLRSIGHEALPLSSCYIACLKGALSREFRQTTDRLESLSSYSNGLLYLWYLGRVDSL
jgi:hypothetical protein